ncbi:SDR family NAD(P)-dependent oxidoreductase [Colwellia sp. E2M01]|uniref:SDR family NAD(P)-dependent oxidoreductase n=1 Tax=Colwellia sp. E2M01 TaxID=2841561 RepID=UPI001C0A4573|nr:SDR family NAD(P)-dependent oxidoreductase [Colwellia sp. E2M01]MBU2869131.1 SDR family NAD(P)-dependent oxidoreductase [Colwellia sp. E2M01]
MKKVILLTGATDGIGFETAKQLVLQGHTVLLHGRNKEKLAQVKVKLAELNTEAVVETYVADLSKLTDVQELASEVKNHHKKLDVLINNAGVFKTPTPITESGHDTRFIVNTLAPFVLTERLLPLMNDTGRVINLSSAAQAPVSLKALQGQENLSDSSAYAQSKLAITMWSFQLAKTLGNNAPSIVAINPASFLGSKMVKEAYGAAGKDLTIGSDILLRAALSDEFQGITGKYFDNDIGDWAEPHPDALNPEKRQVLLKVIQEELTKLCN